MIIRIHTKSGAVLKLGMLAGALAFVVVASKAGAQSGNKDEEGKKQPAVYKAITKPKTINKASTDNAASSNMRKTVPIKPSMKIPPHFPHPPANYDAGPPISPSGTGYTSPTKKGQPTPPSKQGDKPKGPTGSGGGDKPKGPAGQGGGAGEKTTLGLSPEEEFDIGVKYKKKPKGFKFSFNIEDYDLAQLIKAIAKITGKKFVLSAKVKQNIKATIIAPTPITASEAYKAFLSVLEVNGLTIVPEGKFLKIVDSVGSASLAVPTYGMGAAYPTDDRVVTRIHKLEYAKSDELAQVLNKFKSKVGDVTSYGLTNSLIMTDYGSNIQRLIKIISALDIPGTGTKIWVEPIHYSSAEDLAGKLQEVMEAAGMTEQKGKGGGLAKSMPVSPKGPKVKDGGSQPTDALSDLEGEATVSKIIAEDRTNALIIVATKGAYLRIIELVRKIDIPIPGEGEIHVHYLQHSDAEELSNTLSSLTQGVKGRKSKGAAKEAGAGELFEGEIKISHDKPTNSLIIVSTTRDYASLRKVIDKLDIPRRQVFVEAIIMEVTLQKVRTLGMSTHGGTASKFGGLDEEGLVYGASSFSGLSSILIDPTSLMGLAVGIRGPEISGAEGILGTGISIPSFGVTINALQTNNDVNILSTPNILATDNEQAEITVGGNVPIQQGFSNFGSMLGAAAGQAGGTSGLAGLAGLAGGYGAPMVSVGRQNVGLTLRITPHINESDQIRMEIEIEISEVSGETDLGPLIDQRMAKTVSVVKDQQTVVIGGLITDNETETIDKVPFLGDIPILGYIFKKKKKRITKRNLLIFLTPYIIRDATDFRAIFNRKMEERREFIELMTAFKTGDYESHVDYTRTNGIIEEIHKTFIELEEEQAMLDQLKLKPPPEHKAIDPIDELIKEALTAPSAAPVEEETVQPELSVQ